MTQVTTAIKTTVILEFVTSPIIRCRANRDMPEYNLTEGQVFYCVKSASSTTNEYHIVVWSYERMQWNCPCTCGEKRNHTLACGHTKAVAKNCSQPHSLQGYKPASKAEKFAALVAKYDMRNQPVATVEPCTVIVEAEKVVAELVAGYSKDYEELAKREKAARGSLASSSRHMEMAPSGRMVFMR